MADEREPPPLFDAVDINSESNDEEEENLFASADSVSIKNINASIIKCVPFLEIIHSLRSTN